MRLYHGSEKIVFHPEYGKGTTANDYGRGFYCTQNAEIGKEWACKKGNNGFLNAYDLDMEGLRICNLNSSEYHILNWLAVLTRYRSYWQKSSIAEDAKDYLQEHFYVDLSPYDVIRGYRADDSYFSFAQDFVMGTISLQKLSRAMQLGQLGEQIVIKSERAFARLNFISYEDVPREIYYNRMVARDLEARRSYALEKRQGSLIDEIYMIDILRGRVKYDELFL